MFMLDYSVGQDFLPCADAGDLETRVQRSPWCNPYDLSLSLTKYFANLIHTVDAMCRYFKKKNKKFCLLVELNRLFTCSF